MEINSRCQRGGIKKIYVVLVQEIHFKEKIKTISFELQPSSIK
jgi:hypothetical protein